jgi:hypothetical protein
MKKAAHLIVFIITLAIVGIQSEEDLKNRIFRANESFQTKKQSGLIAARLKIVC